MTESPAKWWTDLTIENVDWRSADPLSNAFVDALLLSLIRAHPMQSGGDKNELERLRDAKEAVFGIKPRDDLKSSRDIPLLELMAHEYISDRGGAQFRRESGEIVWGEHDSKLCRGIKTLARDVVQNLKKEGRHFDPMIEEESVVSRLARKFKAQQDDLIEQVVITQGVETGYMLKWIEEARDFFGPFAIPVAAPDDPARDLKRLF